MEKMFLITALLLGNILGLKAEVGNVSGDATEVAYVIPEQKIEMYDFSNLDIKSISKYLRLDSEQTDEISDNIARFSNNMIWSYSQPNRKLLVNNSVELHLKEMSWVLTKKQFHKYLRVLNAEFNNRGIDWM